MNQKLPRQPAAFDGRVRDLRQRTQGFTLDAAFVERVMLAVNVAEAEVAWLGETTARRSLWVCGALVAFSLVWALQSQGPSVPALLATTGPMEAAW